MREFFIFQIYNHFVFTRNDKSCRIKRIIRIKFLMEFMINNIFYYFFKFHYTCENV